MKVALLYERYSHIGDVCQYFDSTKKEDGYGGLIGHIIELKNSYHLVPSVGCMHTMNTVYCLHQRYGIKMYVRIGSCGVRRQGISLGETLIMREAVNRDAISEKYFSSALPQVDNELLNLFRNSFSVRVCNTYTLDVIWKEPDKSSDTVDMETSALYAYANANDLQAISISVARDNSSNRITNEIWRQEILNISKKTITLFEVLA